MLLDPGLGKKFGRTQGEKGEGNTELQWAWKLVSSYRLTEPGRGSQGTREEIINGGFGSMSLLYGSPCLSSPTDNHWTGQTSQMKVSADKRFPISPLKIQDKWWQILTRQKKNFNEKSYSKFRGSQVIAITNRFSSSVLVFVIHLWQHNVKGLMQPSLRINHDNYQEQKSLPQ